MMQRIYEVQLCKWHDKVGNDADAKLSGLILSLLRFFLFASCHRQVALHLHSPSINACNICLIA